MLNEPNVSKIRESVLFLLNSASGDLDQYKIAKAVFLADVSHLNRYGRPITYDNYVAMDFGPVPSKTYELLSKSPETLEVEVKAQEHKRNFFGPLRRHEELELSESDEIELESALKTVEPMSFGKLMKLTHDHIAWKTARQGKKNRAPQMEYAQLFEIHDQVQADYIARFSNQVGCAT